MSNSAWERAAGKAAKLATVSFVAALAATTTAKAEGQIMQGAAPAGYGQPMMGQPQMGQPMFGQPAFAQQSFGQPAFAPQGMAPQMMQSHMQLPQFQAAPQAQIPGQIPAQGIAPASASTFSAPQGQMTPPAGWAQAQPQFGQRTPIFANTSAMGVTYGPPSYTPPEGFDPKMASFSPLPSHMMQGGWGQQAPWGQAQIPNPAGAPIYGGYGQPMQAASASMYAPAEPSYAPAEPLRPNYSAAQPVAAQPTYESIDVTQSAAAPLPASSYSYQMAPATGSTYVGQSQEIAPSYTTSADPYSVVTQGSSAYEMGGTATSVPAYNTTATTMGTPTYEPAPAAYQAAPAYEPAPSYAPAPSYESSSITAPSYYGQSSSFSSGSNHFVQVGAFRNIARAERLVRKLQSAGEQPIITQATVRGKLYHRVRIPAADKRDAAYVRDRVRGLGYYEARTVRG